MAHVLHLHRRYGRVYLDARFFGRAYALPAFLQGSLRKARAYPYGAVPDRFGYGLVDYQLFLGARYLRQLYYIHAEVVQAFGYFRSVLKSECMRLVLQRHVRYCDASHFSLLLS